MPARYAALPQNCSASYSAKFERCVVFRFRVNDGHETDRQTDGRTAATRPTKGGPRTKCDILYRAYPQYRRVKHMFCLLLLLS